MTDAPSFATHRAPSFACALRLALPVFLMGSACAVYCNVSTWTYKPQSSVLSQAGDCLLVSMTDCIIIVPGGGC